jgi:predicted outer membrane protein
MHPLTPDLSTLSDEELAKKVQDLNRRMTQAWSSGNGELLQQVQMMLEDYNEELNKRQRKMMEDLAKKAGRDFDDIIDIK